MRRARCRGGGGPRDDDEWAEWMSVIAHMRTLALATVVELFPPRQQAMYSRGVWRCMLPRAVVSWLKGKQRTLSRFPSLGGSPPPSGTRPVHAVPARTIAQPRGQAASDLSLRPSVEQRKGPISGHHTGHLSARPSKCSGFPI